ncbi:hypothetical protein [Methylobacter svalbardensis]|uniref:hypothetical protein n=1 Tax=Methylobacter svalbardensis TaxID=3080016 RepID=UPI0030ECD9AD
MALFRNITFQRILSLTFLCTALLSQTQILYACELMDGKPKLVCCCGESMSDGYPMSESCAMQKNTDEGRCCDVSQDSLTDVVMTHSSSTADFLTLLLDGPQPPPVIDYQELLPASPQANLRLAIPPHEPLLLSSGKQTYLLTGRLRL